MPLCHPGRLSRGQGGAALRGHGPGPHQRGRAGPPGRHGGAGGGGLGQRAGGAAAGAVPGTTAAQQPTAARGELVAAKHRGNRALGIP